MSAAVVRGQKNPLYFGLPARLKKAREAAGMTRVAIEAASQVSNGTVSHIEKSAPGVAPLIATVERIARALGVDPCALAYGAEGPLRFQQKRQASAAQGPGLGGPEPPRTGGLLLHEGLPARLMLAREARGVSRKALGKAAGLSLTAISNLEEGRNVANVDSAERLAVSLDVAPCWLAFGVGEGPLP